MLPIWIKWWVIAEWTICFDSAVWILFVSQMMCLDVLDNMPHLRMSSSQFKMILLLPKECHVQNVPSFGAFHKMQANLHGMCGSEPTPHISTLGNLFYVNDVQDSVAHVGTLIKLHVLVILITEFLGLFKSRSRQASAILSWRDRWLSIGSVAGWLLDGVQTVWVYFNVCLWLEAFLHWWSICPQWWTTCDSNYLDQVMQSTFWRLCSCYSYRSMDFLWLFILSQSELFLSCQSGWALGEEVISVPAISSTHNYFDIISGIGRNILWHGKSI